MRICSRRVSVLAASLLLSVAVLSAQSVDKAKLLFANKLYADAKKEAIALVFSDRADAEKAEALNLLGAIAVEQGDYRAAITNWSELISKHPSSPLVQEAQAKLQLVKRLADRESPMPEQSQMHQTVLIAGVAPEHPAYADQAVLEFMNYLGSKQVRATNQFPGRLSEATSGRVAEVTLPNLLAKAREGGASSVLYIYIHFRGMENMRVECYAPDGRKLWQEKVAASLGMSPSGMTEGFVRRMKAKLERHIGDQCFPVTETSR
jgi:tetratricopeptide (TPR) repeat protein